MRKILTVLLLTFLSSIAFAQTFTGSIDDDWDKAGNWFPAGVPGAGASVIINAGTSCKVYSSSVANIQEVSFMGGTLTIDGILIIDGAPFEALPIQGNVVVNGILGTVNAMDNNIHLYPGAQMIVNFGGSVSANISATNNGIYNEGIVQNNGTITIKSPAANGFENRGILSNPGTINVSTAGNVGLLNMQSMTSTGQININTTTSYGMYHMAGAPAFFNGGSISIVASSAAGLRCDADLTNIIGKSIVIDGSSDKGMEIASGVTVINNGVISIANSSMKGLVSSGNFTNAAVLEIKNSGLMGMENLPVGVVTNSGYMTVNIGGIGISNEGDFKNSAVSVIEVSNTTAQGIVQNSTLSFDNSGDIILTSIGTLGVEMANSGDFSNSGSLTLNGGIGYGGMGIFVNTGLVKGTGNIKGSHFLNVGDIAPGLSPGSLTISETYDHGAGNYLAEINPGVGNDLLILSDLVAGLGGVLTLTTTSTPASGTVYSIISSPVTDISAMTFSIVNAPAGWTVIYNAHTVDVMYATPAPVELISFDGEKVERGISLNWKTATEKNNDGFEVLRSTDGVNWESIAWIKGHGSSIIEQKYSFLDTKPNADNNYYQLKQIDFDGVSELSNVVSIRWKQHRTEFTITPNPATDYIKVISEEITLPQEVVLIDAMGRLVKQLDWNGGNISLDGVDAGIYYIQLKSANKITTSQPLLVN